MTAVRILIVVTLAVGLLAAGCDDTDPPPAPSTLPPDVTVLGPCLPKCGNVEQR